MGLLAMIVLGALAGLIASMMMGSKGGMIINIILGVVGAVVGGLVMGFLGQTGVSGFNLYSLAVAVLGAVILIAMGRIFTGRKPV